MNALEDVSDLQLLASVAEALAACEDEPALLAATTGLLCEALDCDSCGFLLLDPAAGLLRPAPSFRHSRERCEPVPVGCGVVGAVAADGRARRIDDVAHARAQTGADSGMRSQLCVPVRFGSSVLGVFCAESRRRAAFSLRDEHRVSVAALQVAFALERLRSAATLKESEERFRSLSAASLDAILVHEGGRIVDVNQALCDLGGYSRDELVGRDGFEIIAPEYRESVYRHLLAEDEAPYEVEAVMRDGSRRAVEVQARSFAYRSRLMRVVSVRDLMAHKQAAAQRDALVRELEARNVELERFGYAVAHDLKTPLVTVKGFADHLERDALEGRTDRIGQDARRIRDAVDRVQRLFDELVAFSRASLPLGPPAAIPAEELVREALRLRGSQLEHTGVPVEIASPLPVVFGDRARLVQVFRHVLEDAAALAAGSVRVEGRPPEENRAVLVVRRSGPGVREHDFDQLLGLERVDGSSDGVRSGLSFVRRVVETHGGRVWVEPGAGGMDLLLGVALPMPPEGGREAATEAGGRPPG